MTTAEFSTACEQAQQIRAQICKVIIGQQSVVDEVLIALFAAGHLLIEGVPGLGKTLLVRALAQCIAGDYSRIQFTPDLMPSDVTGHALYDLKTDEFKIRRGPVFTNVLLADEINRAPAKTQAALLEVMQETQVTIEGESFTLQPPFIVLATQNPVEHEGTYPLPEAQLDRFLLKIQIEYPSAEEERRLVTQITSGHIGDQLDVSQINAIVRPEQILEIQNRVAHIAVDPQVVDYAVRIVHATRGWSGVTMGAGPRGSISLIRAARSRALLAERDFVTPDDIKGVAKSVLRHRMLLGAELEIEGHTVDHLLDDILNNVEAPRS